MISKALYMDYKALFILLSYFSYFLNLNHLLPRILFTAEVQRHEVLYTYKFYVLIYSELRTFNTKTPGPEDFHLYTLLTFKLISSFVTSAGIYFYYRDYRIIITVPFNGAILVFKSKK